MLLHAGELAPDRLDEVGYVVQDCVGQGLLRRRPDRQGGRGSRRPECPNLVLKVAIGGAIEGFNPMTNA